MGYKYIDPVKHGYKKFKTPRKLHNELLPEGRQNVFGKIESYYKDHQILFEYTPSFLGKVASILIFPYVLIVHGLGSLSEIYEDYLDLFMPKKRGSFSTEVVYQRSYNRKINSKFVILEGLYLEQHEKK